MRTPSHVMASITILAVSSTAGAAPTTDDLSFSTSASATLTLSADALDTLFNISASQLSEVSPGTGEIIGYPGGYTQASFSLPGASLVYDDGTKEIMGLSTSGGFRVEAGPVAGILVGGSFEVSGLAIDFSAQRVDGTIQGQSNGGTTVSYTGTIFNIPLMTYNPASWQSPTYSVQLNAITLDPQAIGAMTSSLGSLLGTLPIEGMPFNFGSMNVSIFDQTLDPPDTMLFTPPTLAVAVPEPGTWALMGLGLMGVVAVRRHHPQQVTRAHI